jgi:outer membrane protein assembly factor BamB
MSSDTVPAPAISQQDHTPAVSARPPRVWPAVVLVGLYWGFAFGLAWTEPGIFVNFLAALASCALLTLLFTVGWLASRRRGRGERLLGVGTAVGGGALSALLSPPTAGVIGWLLLTLPWVFTTWTVWLVLARRTSARTRLVGLVAVFLLTWGAFALVRMDGLRGEGKIILHWRWSPVAEDLYLAERARQGAEAPPAPETALTLRPGDWPGFRGPDRDGVVRGTRIATDWGTAPPRLVWRRRVGPAWSSVAVVGDRLFTQEQRGPAEAVVCLDAATGREVWAHEDPVRHSDGQGRAGPRATPTFAGGHLYALGATGILNCLDAATGERRWSKNLAADARAAEPMWGYACSPLVVAGLVVVAAGGDGTDGLLAYRADSGKPEWTAPAAAKVSSSSPQAASLGGEDQVLFFGNRGLVAVAAASGEPRWHYDLAGGGPSCVQPHPVGADQVVIGSENAHGAVLLDVRHDGAAWAAAQHWFSKDLKPSFNDFVIHDGFVYGFDGSVFCCVDLKTGKRRWREGRYDHGQVLLLADQSLLLVVSEGGEAILLATSPERHEELGRFQAVNGTTWNHPVVAHGRLYVRNAEEMACYELGPDDTAATPSGSSAR